MKRIMLLAAMLTACGGGGGGYGGGDNPPPDDHDPAWAQVAPIVQRNCGGCHDGSKEPAFTSGAVFKASAAKAKLQSGAMPKAPKTISAEDKAALLSYLGG